MPPCYTYEMLMRHPGCVEHATCNTHQVDDGWRRQDGGLFLAALISTKMFTHFQSAPKLRKAMVTIPARWLIRKALANLRSPNRTTGASLQAKHALHDRLSRKNLEKNSFLTFLVPKKKLFNPLRNESERKSHFKSLNSKALFRVYTPEN